MNGERARGTTLGGEGEPTPLFDQIVGRHGWPLADGPQPRTVAGEGDEPGDVVASAAAAGSPAAPVRE
ncbi:hypothetical protein [Prauserella flavalba]|uniref:Uncharacterized protein n=1 Tax=Prauserella flavalba TaxID=1477506 RepID=A0A318LQG3_9PSEU|nr:hypothetical protein [Prauserella flavalba]PXY36743.1 hypothetical protein BA062_15440 [Prauserella flavalba]